MTGLMYLSDPYAVSFDAIVVDIGPNGWLMLNQTAFYPTGGGQPHDTGSIARGADVWRITDVSKRDGGVVHALDDAPGALTTGATVQGRIDWDRRYRLMRTHTALHVLCGVVFREFGALVTGGNMGIDKARMDFELDDLNETRVRHIETTANAVIRDGRRVTWKSLPRDEAFRIPDLIRTRVNLLPEGITEVRVVEIEGLDIQADGGTHVRNTREVGGLRVIGTRSKGRGNKRLEIELIDCEIGPGEGT
ncbi:MAG TPA: alanyl-tRNA editing protein [Thermomicrobiales bacterium]|nr:alanyl-tRNA editing protein [Thermomicrobiales bacterium]